MIDFFLLLVLFGSVIYLVCGRKFLDRVIDLGLLGIIISFTIFSPVWWTKVLVAGIGVVTFYFRKSLIPFFKKMGPIEKWAVRVLVILYIFAVFGSNFIAPYNPTRQFRSFSNAPPTPVRGIFTLSPFIYKYEASGKGERYEENKQEKVRIHFLTDGRLFSTDEGSPIFLLGTDHLGRDIFSRLMSSAWISMLIGVLGAVPSLILGLIIGSISGFFRGRVDFFLQRLIELFLSIPSLPFLLLLGALIPAGVSSQIRFLLIIFILSLTLGWTGLARTIRGMVLSVVERDHVLAAKALGASTPRILVKHVIPLVFNYALISTTLAIPGLIIGEASLSFLGLGVQEPAASWGNMLSVALDDPLVLMRPWVLTPGFLIFFAVLSFNILGDFVRDYTDPYTRGRL